VSKGITVDSKIKSEIVTKISDDGMTAEEAFLINIV